MIIIIIYDFEDTGGAPLDIRDRYIHPPSHMKRNLEFSSSCSGLIRILSSITGDKFSSPSLGSEFCLGVGEHGFASMWQITLQDVSRI